MWIEWFPWWLASPRTNTFALAHCVSAAAAVVVGSLATQSNTNGDPKSSKWNVHNKMWWHWVADINFRVSDVCMRLRRVGALYLMCHFRSGFGIWDHNIPFHVGAPCPVKAIDDDINITFFYSLQNTEDEILIILEFIFTVKSRVCVSLIDDELEFSWKYPIYDSKKLLENLEIH